MREEIFVDKKIVFSFSLLIIDYSRKCQYRLVSDYDLLSFFCFRSFINSLIADLLYIGTICRRMDTAGSCRFDNNQ